MKRSKMHRMLTRGESVEYSVESNLVDLSSHFKAKQKLNQSRDISHLPAKFNVVAINSSVDLHTRGRLTASIIHSWTSFFEGLIQTGASVRCEDTGEKPARAKSKSDLNNAS